MKDITVLHNQSLWDIAIQEYGAADGVLFLILDNPAICNFQNSIPIGAKLIIDEDKIINKQIVDFYKRTNYKPATAIEINDDGNNVSFTSGFSLGFK